MVDRCPSCNTATGTALGRDGLCDRCAGRGRYKPAESGPHLIRAATPAELDAAIAAEVERMRAERAEAEPCIHCGAPIDPVDGSGHDPGCSYETPGERAYNESTAPAMECPRCGYCGPMNNRLL